GAWQLRVRWLDARARETALYHQQVKPLAAPPVVAIPPVQPVAAIGYGDVAQKMLFSKDRNPTVEIDVAPVKPMPPLPVAYGVMVFGEVRSAILSPRPGVAHRAYAPGEMVGDFKLVSVDPEELVFDWDGQTIVKKVEELVAKGRPTGAAPAPETAVAPPTAPPPVTTVVTAPVRPGPGMQMTPELRACQPGDPTPAGTVMEGMRKLVTRTPFGEQCRWELIR
ncbi:MAG: hypothetical protein AAB654_24345, partial [Acidobacteriota bacterium]